VSGSNGKILQIHNPLDDLVVGIALGELGYSEFWAALMKNRDFGYLWYTGRVNAYTGGYVHGNHNRAVRDALRSQNWKRLLLLEHDHEFPDDTFRRHALYTDPVVAGTYVLRDVEEPLPVFYNWDAERTNVVRPTSATMKGMLIDQPGLYPMDIVPMGCTSIRRDVLTGWPEEYPYFSSYSNAAGSTISDDVWFCRIAQDNGWKMYVDTSLHVKHYAKVPLDVSYFIRWWNSVGAKLAEEREAQKRG
jgi:hypothetical protein